MLILRKFTFWLALAGLASVTLLTLRMRASLQEPVSPPPVSPALKPFPKSIGASGLVESLRENTAVGVPQAGLVRELHVKVWSRVKAGDILLALDDRDLAAARSPLEAQVRVAEAQLARLQDQLSRWQAVADARVLARDDVRNRELDVRVAEAQLDAARAALAQNTLLRERLVVRAPIDGTVLQVNVRVGESLVPGSATPPLVLGNIDEVQVRADVDEQLAPRVREGAKAVGYIKGAPAEAIPLTFVRVEPYVIPKRSLTGASIERVDTRVLQVIYRFPVSPDRRIYVGQQLDVFIEEP